MNGKRAEEGNQSELALYWCKSIHMDGENADCIWTRDSFRYDFLSGETLAIIGRNVDINPAL